MRIAVGSDHAGFALKSAVKPLLEGAGHEVVDVGTADEESTDYSLYGERAARRRHQRRLDQISRTEGAAQ